MSFSPALCRRLFRLIAVIEAITWAGLLVGMAFKYVLADDERGVQLFGPLHGAAFVAYVLCVLAVRHAFRWSPVLTLAALACSVPPFASIAFELWAERTGRLDPSSRGERRVPESAAV